MSAVIKIDAEGSAPSFMDRVQAGMDRVVRSERNLDSALKRLSSSFQAASTNSEILAGAAETLAHKFAKGALFGSAAAVGTILASSMKEVGAKILSVGQSAETAMSGISGIATTFEAAAARAQNLSQAAADTRKSMEELAQSNIVNSAVFKVFGGEGVLSNLDESLKGLAAAELLSGIRVENKSTQRLLGAAGPDQRTEVERQIKMEQELAAFRSSKAFLGAAPDAQRKLLAEFEKNQALKESLENRKTREKQEKEIADFRKEIELKNGDYAKNLMDEAAADENRRNRELQFKREDFQRGLDQARLEAVKMEKTRAENEARIPRRLQGAFGSAASDILGVAGQAGSPYAGIVNRLQKQSDQANLKSDVADLEAKAMAMVADRGQIGPGLIDPRNKYGGLKSKQTIVEEFLTQQQGKKDAGRRTLDDIYQVLDDALREITSTPRVGAN